MSKHHTAPSTQQKANIGHKREQLKYLSDKVACKRFIKREASKHELRTLLYKLEVMLGIRDKKSIQISKKALVNMLAGRILKRLIPYDIDGENYKVNICNAIEDNRLMFKLSGITSGKRYEAMRMLQADVMAAGDLTRHYHTGKAYLNTRHRIAANAERDLKYVHKVF